MNTDNRTDAERRYDAERDGTLYTRQAEQAAPPVEEHIDLMIELLEKIEDAYGVDAAWEAIGVELSVPVDVPLDDHERAILEAIVAASNPTDEDAGQRLLDAVGRYVGEIPHPVEE